MLLLTPVNCGSQGSCFTVIFNPTPLVSSRWVTGAAVVNAFYSSSKNQIGTLQPVSQLLLEIWQITSRCLVFGITIQSPFSVPSRDPPAAFLQQRPGQISELRRHWHGNRSWDHARLRWQWYDFLRCRPLLLPGAALADYVGNWIEKFPNPVASTVGVEVVGRKEKVLEMSNASDHFSAPWVLSWSFFFPFKEK